MKLLFALFAAMLEPRPISAGAASDPALTVIVADPSNLRVPGATLEMTLGSRTKTLVSNDRGEAVFDELAPGRYELKVTLTGFAPFTRSIDLSQKAQRLDVRLALANRIESLAVAPQEKVLATLGSVNVLTPEQIAQLPDDPDELEAAIQAIAGPGAMLRVNGFSGARLPPKSQIALIRFQLNPVSAEFHDVQFNHVDIQTKPGSGSWRTSVRTAFRDDALNARSPLAPERVPDSHERGAIDLGGPLRKGKTSASLSLEGRLTDTFRTGRAQTLQGPRPSLIASSNDRFDTSLRVENSWGKTHTLRGEFQSLSWNQTGLGVAGLDLEERAFGQKTRDSVLRLSDTGVLRGRLVSEMKFQRIERRVTWDPVSDAPTTRVSGAFNAGGAGIDGERKTTEITFESNFDWSRGKQAFRGGWLLRSQGVHSDERRNVRGTLFFASLGDYDAQRPLLFSQRVGDPRVAFTQTDFGLYVQDEIKVSNKASLGLGARYEIQSNVARSGSLAPRAAFTYAINGKTNAKLSAGRFVDWLPLDAFEQTVRLDGEKQREVVSQQGTATASSVASQWTVSDDLVLPGVSRYSAGVERNFGATVRGSIEFARIRGRSSLRSRNLGLLSPGSSRTTTRILQIESDGRSKRDQVDVRLSRMLGPDTKLGFFAGYTWSRFLNESDTALSLPSDERASQSEWGPAPSDVRHRVFAMANWRGARGFTAGLLLQGASGAPYEITTGRDDNGDGFVTDRPFGVPRNAARARARVNLDLRVAWARGFGSPRTGGTPTIRVVRANEGDGVPDVPGSGAEKRFRVSIHAQFFNVLNRTNALAMGGVTTSPLFGQIVAADPGRRTELGVSVTF